MSLGVPICVGCDRCGRLLQKDGSAAVGATEFVCPDCKAGKKVAT